jgi:hypothetical protein
VKRFVLLALLCACICATATAAVNPAITKAHAASHKLEMSRVTGGEAGHCSGTAIAPHAILTATHCSSPSSVITIDGKDADVLGTMGDGLDHTIIMVSATFKDYVDVNVVKLEQADEVFVFGNPGPFDDVFRKGYVAGFDRPRSPETFAEIMAEGKTHAHNKSVQITYYDLNGFFGDSGSGIFGSDGRVVGVTSFITGGSAQDFILKFMGGYELRISPAQLKLAREFVPPAAPEDLKPIHLNTLPEFLNKTLPE